MKTNVAQFHYNLGKVYGHLGDIEKEIKCYQRAIKRDTNYAPPVFSLGCLYFKIGKYENSKLCFERVIELDPNLPQAYW
jgi:tetratricopeptide (TPR) repeat protein